MKIDKSTNEGRDEFADVERQLRELSPRRASPLLAQRIERDIDAPLMAHRWYAPLATAAALLICAALMAALLSLSHQSSAPRAPLQARLQVMPPDLTQPTFIAYRHALADSETALIALLDAQARQRRDHHAPAADDLPLHVRSLPPL